MSDLVNYSNMVDKGDLLVINETSNYAKIPITFSGLYNISSARCDILDKDQKFVHLFACGHDRVWLRVK